MQKLLLWALVAAVFVLSVSKAPTRDLGQWDDPLISKWFRELKQPDDPSRSCCGESDAYWADDYEVLLVSVNAAPDPSPVPIRLMGDLHMRAFSVAAI